MKILITGTAGFIGMHLAIRLAAEGHEVTGLDNINSYYDANLKYARLAEQGIKKEDILYNKLLTGANNIKFIEIDLQDAGNLNALFATQHFEIVINLAAQAGVRYSITNPKDYINSNIIGFYNILEASRNFPIKHLLYASSSSVYGNAVKFPFLEEDNTDAPISFYAATKKSNEVMAHTYSHLYSIKTTGLRFFTVYGPWGRPDMAMFMFTENILNDKPIKVFNNGDLYRDFTYVDDIISGVTSIVNGSGHQKEMFQLFNIGNSKPVKLLDFIYAIEEATGVKAKLDFQPMQEGDVQMTYADTDKLMKQYNYKPNTDLKTGVAKFVAWYKGFYKN
ncbi:MAG: NAD-dependent epimerase/dehydratase family protein [Ferruginibacter sp.]